MQQKRLATFDFPKDDSDDQALERAWNSFSEALRAQGLRPSEECIRSTPTSVTFRVFVIEHELMNHTLDFDIARLEARSETRFP